MTVLSAMRCSKSRHLAGAGLLAVSPAALAQAVVQQLLSVRFETVVTAVPLSDWLTAGIALLLAATAAVALRRQGARGGRLLGALLALATGAVLIAMTGQRIVSEARAGLDLPLIKLTTSPGTLNVSQYVGMKVDKFAVVVTNTTGRTAGILAITLTQPAPYEFDVPPGSNACAAGTQLAAGEACKVYLRLE